MAERPASGNYANDLFGFHPPRRMRHDKHQVDARATDSPPALLSAHRLIEQHQGIRIVKNTACGLETDAVLAPVDPTLRFIPFEPHNTMLLQECSNIKSEAVPVNGSSLDLRFPGLIVQTLAAWLKAQRNVQNSDEPS